MKKCFKCETIKPLHEFYRHPRMADGHVNKCKKCNRRDVSENRAKKIEYYRQYDRDRGNRQSEDYVRDYRSKYPAKYAAHSMINRRLRDGRIVKPDECEKCLQTSENLHGHHDDYAYPLIVRWLCPVCHKAWHTEHGEAPNGA